MLMPLHYKDLRDELDEILWHFNVPKSLYHRLMDLRLYLMDNIHVHDLNDQKKLIRALEIIKEIMPQIRLEKI